MILVYLFQFFLFSNFLRVLSYGDGGGYKKCPPYFECGNLGRIYFPFTTPERQHCGMLAINGCDDRSPNATKSVQLKNEGKPLQVKSIIDWFTLMVHDEDLSKRLESSSCDVFSYNVTLPASSPLGYFQIKHNVSVFKCSNCSTANPPKRLLNYTCSSYDIYFVPPDTDESLNSLAQCSTVLLPINALPISADPFTFLTADILFAFQYSDVCNQCFHGEGGRCQLDSKGMFNCSKACSQFQYDKGDRCQLDIKRNFYCKHGDRSWKWKLALGIGLGVGILIICLILYRWKHAPSHVQLRSINSNADPYSNPDPEASRVFFGVPVFSYKELEEATDNFDRTRIVGDGGFGIVYYGKLQDGREVAVKRLYEHNYKRVEQFMNEVEILTRLRHKNLVSLYGCTSRHSRELLLVYEYIPNGTLASHLHAHLAKPGLLPWPIRMKIAIETATALAYLHASDIIHRDVKTNNILLDKSYCVKVADFGLSRLFPNDVTHVSTGPQGTPGYVDPEYHQCYQLTSKSDVYSFGVVLIELISSMPAVNTMRHRDEVNLANLAIKKIKKSAVSELVDPSLGFELDNDIRRMIISVAELAFRCLQWDKEVRPSMDEVLEVLRKIESGKDEPEHPGEADVQGAGISHSNIHPPPPASPDWYQVRLLNNTKLPSSPNTVNEKWESESTTPHVSS